MSRWVAYEATLEAASCHTYCCMLLNLMAKLDQVESLSFFTRKPELFLFVASKMSPGNHCHYFIYITWLYKKKRGCSNVHLKWYATSILTWKCLPHYWPFVTLVTIGFSSQRARNAQLWYFFAAILKKLLNKHSICWWFETPGRSCDCNADVHIYCWFVINPLTVDCDQHWWT